MQKDISVGLVTGKNMSEGSIQPAWKMVVGRDVIVPVMNGDNPFIAEIQRRGMSAMEFAAIFTAKGDHSGRIRLNDKTTMTVKPVLPADESVLSYLADFLQTDHTMLATIANLPEAEYLAMIGKDPQAIGFCRLAALQAFQNEAGNNSIFIVPFDIDSNGSIDGFENVYGSYDELIHAVWIGRYPKALYSRIYAISGKIPQGAASLDFMEWILTQGQSLLSENGFSPLTYQEKQSAINQSHGSFISVSALPSATAINKAYLLIAGIILASGLILLVFVRIFREKPQVNGSIQGVKSFFSEKTVDMPAGLFYDRSHTWIFMEKSGLVLSGIDAFLPKITGRITRIKMKSPGEVISRGKAFLSIIQDGKKLEILAPLSGTIRELNTKLEGSPGLLNSDPLSDGWIYRIEPDNWIKEIRNFMMGSTYSEWIKTEFIRLKDFLIRILKSGMLEESRLVMQEGGEVKYGILADYGPEVWEEFQSDFIHLSV